uniref:hypothetical protein n=1 Tax=Ningiella ruwaisensis TaxID=2364274 RepID=UPI00109F281B|nr:hypothetical protein [Ningiella ruwaisensis]
MYIDGRHNKATKTDLQMPLSIAIPREFFMLCNFWEHTQVSKWIFEFADNLLLSACYHKIKRCKSVEKIDMSIPN